MCPQGDVEECIWEQQPYRFVQSRKRLSKLTAKVSVNGEEVVCE
jgi:hypothetical protein